MQDLLLPYRDQVQQFEDLGISLEELRYDHQVQELHLRRLDLNFYQLKE